MTWIDYKKAYDLVPHCWILRSMGLVGVATNITSFVEKGVKMWNTTLAINGETIGGSKDKKRHSSRRFTITTPVYYIPDTIDHNTQSYE